jgi:hypothetical protein
MRSLSRRQLLTAVASRAACAMSLYAASHACFLTGLGAPYAKGSVPLYFRAAAIAFSASGAIFS